jgi:hypothetical protein
MLAVLFNQIVWFKQVLLPKSIQRSEIQTVRRVMTPVSGNVIGSGQYQHIRLTSNPKLGAIVHTIQHLLNKFIDKLSIS